MQSLIYWTGESFGNIMQPQTRANKAETAQLEYNKRLSAAALVVID